MLCFRPNRRFVPASERYPASLQRNRQESRLKRQAELLALQERACLPRTDPPPPPPQELRLCPNIMQTRTSPIRKVGLPPHTNFLKMKTFVTSSFLCWLEVICNPPSCRWMCVLMTATVSGGNQLQRAHHLHRLKHWKVRLCCRCLLRLGCPCSVYFNIQNDKNLPANSLFKLT